MSQGDSPVAVLTRALAAHEFVYKGRNGDNWLIFSGAFVADGQMHPVSLLVHPQGSELPVVRLEVVPDKLRPVAPHVGGDGVICYAAAGSIVLDVFDLPGQTIACIQRAESVLSSLLRGEMVSDLEEEFFAYWHGEFCFLDIRRSSRDDVEGLMVGRGESRHGLFAITNDRTRTLQKLKAIGLHPCDNFAVLVRRVRTNVKPRPLVGNWPPRTVSDVLRWQGIMDAPCRRKLDEHITDAFKKGEAGIVCLVESPMMPYGFIVNFNDDERSQKKSRITDTRTITYRSKIMPLSCLRIDDDYIAQRNSPEQATLAQRRIALVGCGTIGGFLAELLLKAGAGINGGELVLVDREILMPQNIGRHRLGFDSVLRNKGTALALDLQRAAPSATVRALPVDAMEANLGTFDLVINATGEESLGHLITRKFSGLDFVPTLTVWIEGPGTAVRGLFRDKKDAACTRCLNSLTRDPLYPVVEGNVPLHLAGQGCESLYVPFPASVSVRAACLGIEMVIAWASGNVSPRLRTCVLDSQRKVGTLDQDPPVLLGCPACGI